MSRSGKYMDSESVCNSKREKEPTLESRISFETVNKTFRLDRKTGFLYRRKNGKRTALPTKNLYCRASLCGRPHYAHRIIWMILHGEWPTQFIDHINGDKNDNRPENLRQVTPLQNVVNRKPAGSRRYLGITWSKRDKHWRANIRIDGKVHCLGYFKTEKEAARAYKVAVIAAHGEYASYSLDPKL